MQTTKLISTISFNTPDFLRGKLHDLVKASVIEYAHWIWHTPEEDQKKAHAHVVLKPNRRLDTSALRNQFSEVVPGEEKPRGCNPFQTSKMKDWLLYAVHDRAYLLRKNCDRKYTYTKEDLHTTEPDLLEENWRDAHEGEDTRMTQVIQLAERGVSFADLCKMGIIPINQLFQFRELWNGFYTPKTERGGRANIDENV